MQRCNDLAFLPSSSRIYTHSTCPATPSFICTAYRVFATRGLDSKELIKKSSDIEIGGSAPNAFEGDVKQVRLRRLINIEQAAFAALRRAGGLLDPPSPRVTQLPKQGDVHRKFAIFF
jgi:hypothetical protein